MPGTKKYAGGWEFDIWDETLAYDQGDVVALGTYLYKAAVATSAGEKPGVATYSFIFSDSTYASTPIGDPMDTETKTLPKWILWDLGADYYYGLLRGVALTPEDDQFGKTSMREVRTLVVRSGFDGRAAVGSDEHIYDNVTFASYGGYGLTAGMNSEWGGGAYAPSAVPWDSDGYGPAGFFYNQGQFGKAVSYQPSTIMAVEGDTGNTVAYWDEGGLNSEPMTAAVFSIYQVFGREFDGDISTTAGNFGDNWVNGGTDTYSGGINGVSPSYQST